MIQNTLPLRSYGLQNAIMQNKNIVHAKRKTINLNIHTKP